MKKSLKVKLILPALASTLVLSTALVPVSAMAATTPAVTISNGSSSTQTSPTQLQQIIAKGNAAISERLTTLGNLVSVVNTTTNKLTTSDRAYLLAEINSEQSGLSTLQTKLDGEVTVSAAKTDYQNIFLQYRVYALVVPKVTMVKAADDQQATETKLSNLSGKLQVRINDESTAGKNVSQEQSWLNSMESDTSNAQSISSSIEESVLTLQPSQYDANHAILSGDFNQLKQAKSDNQSAYNYAKEIVSALKSM